LGGKSRHPISDQQFSLKSTHHIDPVLQNHFSGILPAVNNFKRQLLEDTGL
jgi:hypothetical protein